MERAAGDWVHTSLSVRDLDAAIAFYSAAFGFEPLFEEELDRAIAGMTGVAGMRCRLAQLKGADGHVLELIEFRPPDGGGEPSPTAVGHGHVAFRVDDLDAATARVTRLGAVPLGAVAGFPEGRAAYLREPAGSVVELTEIRPEAVA